MKKNLLRAFPFLLIYFVVVNFTACSGAISHAMDSTHRADYKKFSKEQLRKVLSASNDSGKSRIFIFRPYRARYWYYIPGYMVLDNDKVVGSFSSSDKGVFVGSIQPPIDYSGMFERHVAWAREPGVLNIRLKLGDKIINAFNDTLLVTQAGKGYYFKIEHKLFTSADYNPLKQITEDEAVHFLANSQDITEEKRK